MHVYRASERVEHSWETDMEIHITYIKNKVVLLMTKFFLIKHFCLHQNCFKYIINALTLELAVKIYLSLMELKFFIVLKLIIKESICVCSTKKMGINIAWINKKQTKSSFCKSSTLLKYFNLPISY